MTYDVFVQGLGLVATLFIVASFTQKDDVRFKVVIVCGTALFTLHFFLLGAYAGAIVGVINVGRTILSMTRYKGNYILAFFIAAYLTMGFITYEQWFDVLPYIAGCGTTYALFKFSGLSLRYAFFATEAAWLTYVIIVKSIGGILTNSAVILVNAVTTYRLLKDKNHDQKI